MTSKKNLITLELARYMVTKKPQTVDGHLIERIETLHLGKDRIQYLRIHFLDGSHVEIAPAGDEMTCKVDCSGVYNESIGEIEIN